MKIKEQTNTNEPIISGVSSISKLLCSGGVQVKISLAVYMRSKLKFN